MCFLSTWCVQGTVTGVEETTVDRTSRDAALGRLVF